MFFLSECFSPETCLSLLVDAAKIWSCLLLPSWRRDCVNRCLQQVSTQKRPGGGHHIRKGIFILKLTSLSMCVLYYQGCFYTYRVVNCGWTPAGLWWQGHTVPEYLLWLWAWLGVQPGVYCTWVKQCPDVCGARSDRCFACWCWCVSLNRELPESGVAVHALPAVPHRVSLLLQSCDAPWTNELHMLNAAAWDVYSPIRVPLVL